MKSAIIKRSTTTSCPTTTVPTRCRTAVRKSCVVLWELLGVAAVGCMGGKA
ncbi:MAG: hypothetical protein JNK02_17275 [Planctomycetes bacterium]|nr:hypothetical protein [Planctomycetota bacterium]